MHISDPPWTPAPSRPYVGSPGDGDASALPGRRLLRRIARPLFRASWRAIEGATIGLALWCALSSLGILPGVLSDTPGVMLLGGAGLVLGFGPLGRVLFGALVGATAAVAIVSLSPMSDIVAQHWVRSDTLPDSGVSAAVVLSAALNPDSTMSGEALDHLLTGLQLVREHRTPLLVTTVTQVRFPAGRVTSETDQERVLSLLDSSIRWISVPAGGSTRGEALASAALLLPRGLRHIAVVASPMHTRRACAVFAAVGFIVTCVPARLRGPGGVPIAGGSSQRLVIFGQLVYELSALAEYRIRGWLPRARDAHLVTAGGPAGHDEH